MRQIARLSIRGRAEHEKQRDDDDHRKPPCYCPASRSREQHMNRQDTVKAFTIAALAFPTLLLAQSLPRTASVPKATCGRMDRTETGLQGQTTPDERSSGKSE